MCTKHQWEQGDVFQVEESKGTRGRPKQTPIDITEKRKKIPFLLRCH